MAGVYRDRTNLYLRLPDPLDSELTTASSYITFRQSFAHNPAKRRRIGATANNGFATQGGESEERRGLMSAGAYDEGDAVIEMDLLPPRWIDIQEEVTEMLGIIARKGAELDKLHQKHVLPGFDDEDVKAREERTIERITQEITRGFHDCQRAIQRIEMMVRDAKRTGSGVSAGDETMARNIQINLASRVQEASAGFRKKQSNYLKSELKRTLQRMLLMGARTTHSRRSHRSNIFSPFFADCDLRSRPFTIGD